MFQKVAAKNSTNVRIGLKLPEVLNDNQRVCYESEA